MIVKLRALKAIAELTEDKVGLETLKEIIAEASANNITFNEVLDENKELKEEVRLLKEKQPK